MTQERKCLGSYIAAGLVLLCVVCSFPCLAEDITIRVLNATVGTPIPRKKIRIELKYDKVRFLGRTRQTSVPHEYADRNKYIDLKTGRDGTAKLHLTRPLPKEFFLWTAVGWWTQCSPDFFRIEDVLRSGVVAENGCKSEITKDLQFTAKPGELVVFARRMSPADRQGPW
jgi:hypothetical protein